MQDPCRVFMTSQSCSSFVYVFSMSIKTLCVSLPFWEVRVFRCVLRVMRVLRPFCAHFGAFWRRVANSGISDYPTTYSFPKWKLSALFVLFLVAATRTVAISRERERRKNDVDHPFSTGEKEHCCTRFRQRQFDHRAHYTLHSWKFSTGQIDAYLLLFFSARRSFLDTNTGRGRTDVSNVIRSKTTELPETQRALGRYQRGVRECEQ